MNECVDWSLPQTPSASWSTLCAKLLFPFYKNKHEASLSWGWNPWNVSVPPSPASLHTVRQFRPTTQAVVLQDYDTTVTIKALTKLLNSRLLGVFSDILCWLLIQVYQDASWGSRSEVEHSSPYFNPNKCSSELNPTNATNISDEITATILLRIFFLEHKAEISSPLVY